MQHIMADNLGYFQDSTGTRNASGGALLSLGARWRGAECTLNAECTDPVGQSWPRGTGSVGDSVGEGYYSVIHIAVLLHCETPSSADARSGTRAATRPSLRGVSRPTLESWRGRALELLRPLECLFVWPCRVPIRMAVSSAYLYGLVGCLFVWPCRVRPTASAACNACTR